SALLSPLIDQRASSRTVRTAAASSSLSAMRNLSSSPTTSVRSATESSCRSATRSSPSRTARESPNSSRATRRISASTSSMSVAERALFFADAQAQDEDVQKRAQDRADPRAACEWDADHLHHHREIVGMAQ